MSRLVHERIKRHESLQKPLFSVATWRGASEKTNPFGLRVKVDLRLDHRGDAEIAEHRIGVVERLVSGIGARYWTGEKPRNESE
jgi:hypothetical protein